MNHDKDTPDLSALVPVLPQETTAEARDELIARVMSRQQALSVQFSKIDHPFATDDAKDDYALARDEFQALLQCSVHMPESVEGIRFLEGWHANRMGQIEKLLKHTEAGERIAIGEHTLVMSEDFARGMRAGLMVVRMMFKPFPLELSAGDEPEEAPPN